MIVAVTGGTGFIGQHLIKSLLEKGTKVHAIVREGSDTAAIDPRATLYRYDGDIRTLTAYCTEQKIAGIVHLASLFLASHTEGDIDSLIDSNIRFGTHLLEAAKTADTRWFLNTGTFWQHFESKTYSPVNLYAATKEAFEAVARFYSETGGPVFTTLKLNDTFGPGDTRPKIFTLWDKISQSGEALGMSPGEQLIDISYIEDVISAYETMIGHLESGSAADLNNQSFAVKAKERVTLKELAGIYQEATGRKLHITWGERPYREREVMTPWENGKPVPGWEPKFTLAEAIKNMTEDNK